MLDRAALRQLFPVTNRLIYFNHAAMGPLSTRAAAAMTKFAEDQRDYGALHWRDWYAEDKALRESAARLIGATPAEIAILKNTSEGISFVAEGLRWREGDNMISTDLEFPSNSVPWRRLARRGVSVRTVQSRNGSYEPEDIERLIDSRTRVVSVSSVAFHHGFAADLAAIGAICSAHNVLFCVDAIQSLGAIPLNVRDAGITFLAADGHKWLCGPEGSAIFFVAEEHRDELEVLESGWTNIERRGRYIDCPIDLLPSSRRFEAGSLTTAAVFGMRAAVDLLLECGVDSIHREVLAVANRLADGIESVGWTLRSPRPLRSGIVAAVPPAARGKALLDLHAALEQETIVCAPRENMLRFSPHAYNTPEEVDTVIEVLASLT